MKTESIHIRNSENNTIELVDFYNNATEDYEYWSKDYNMHFGYFIPFKTCVFKRDALLNQMNHQVMKRLQINSVKHRLIDLGCGMGGSMRYALKNNKHLIAYGVTLPEFQVKYGNELLQGLNGIIIKEDYNNTSFHSETFDSAIAIESFCHSGHSSNSIKEAYRLLKPGGRLVIADAFIKKHFNELCSGGRLAYQKLCDHWSLEKIESIKIYKEKLRAAGFTNISIENISFRVAPSVFHVPFAIIGFTLKELFKNHHISKESLHNLKGSFYALLAGLHLKSFGYYLITCVKE
ncbi:methyltransferase domain-containing protein [Psychroserpens sp. XS_ASV72]|uniref:methyltransferase domain-containing protein n=1 Tax=Psychroserpens sp. XS_ASV72 TaxID=3241293 RepID=UPI0035147E97